MSESYPGLTFDEDGICQVCCGAKQDVNVDWIEQKRELERRISNIKKEATKYHVIVPWSGGKDSTYVLYVMKKLYGLNVLALNFDNGFKSDAAYQNLDRISRTLGVDLVILRPDWTLMRDLYKHHLKEKGELCSVCNMVGYMLIFSFTLKEMEMSNTSRTWTPA
jgi:tRNA(Ile)-lysidine synthase TilS/MesJ